MAFRGTDFTIVGWCEDFMMGYQVVPAQRYAAKYNKIVNKVIRIVPEFSNMIY
ncbi:DUF2974 domain-containing protein [Bariatricus massiliensis]|nr:DUF2974 domain-containing protein [Bariatricus massiliensis]